MKAGVLVLSLLVFLTAVLAGQAESASLDCQGGIVSSGDSCVDLLMKCGEPDAKESHDEEIVDRFADNTKHKLFVKVEEWTYNFGPTQFMRIVVLKNGKVSYIKTGKYGYSIESKPARQDCSEQVVSVGDSKADVLSKCGEPTWKDSRQEEIKQRLDSGQIRNVFVTVEEWTYNLGPNRFVRILTFRNSKLVDIKTGGYGYVEK